MPNPTSIPTFNFMERSSGEYTAKITGNDGAMLPGSTLTTLVVTLYAIRHDQTQTIINSRDQQTLLNANGGTVYDTPQPREDETTYNFRWLVTPDDTVILDDFLNYERHIALFEWTVGSTVAGKHEIIINVKNINRVN